MNSMIVGFNLTRIPMTTVASGSTTASEYGAEGDSAPAELSEIVDLSGDEGGEYTMASGSVDTMEQNATRDEGE